MSRAFLFCAMPNYIAIKNRAVDERPREKLLTQGKSSLSNTELIGILLSTGTKNKSAVDLARDLLHLAKNDLNQLVKLSLHDLCSIEGIGPAKAIMIISALELGTRRTAQAVIKAQKITSSQDVYDFLSHKIADLSHEEFYIVLLNRANHIIRSICISKGGLSQTIVDPKLVFNAALQHKASAIILAHNHPSGQLKPSQADTQLTSKLTSAGKLLDIQILDHIIVTQSNHFSFADDGLM